MDSKAIQSKKVKVSKNRKKGWKKHSNIDEVEEYLEDLRADERQGGPIDGKANESLFFVDAVAKQVTDNLTDNASITRKKRKYNDPLKSLQSLENASLVKPPTKPYQLQTRSKKQPRTKVRNLQPKGGKNVSQKRENFFNLWEEEGEKDEIEALSKEISSYQVAKVPSHRYQKPSLLPAVEPPHPGASYNPTFQDHQSLLIAATQVEMIKEKEEAHLDRVLRKKFPTVDNAPTEATWIAEMSQGLCNSSSDDEKGQSDNDEEPIIKTWGKRTDRETRKTIVERNAEKAKKLKLKLMAEEKLERKLRNDFQRIKQTKKDIIKKEMLSLEKQKVKEKIKLNALYQPRRLGKEKYIAPDLEVNLTEELRGSLRKVKIEGSVLEDRFKSLQKRNIIEPRSKKTLKRKYKLKKQVKRSHREAQLEIDKLLKRK